MLELGEVAPVEPPELPDLPLLDDEPLLEPDEPGELEPEPEEEDEEPPERPPPPLRLDKMLSGLREVSRSME